ncbi:L-lactate permease [Sphingobacterium phlebotomi]|nr:L-lactate permease [Sphingobacterium phlebotomi]
MQAILAFCPIFIAMVLLIGLRVPARYAMPVVLIVTAGIGIFIWEMDVLVIVASAIQGLFITVDVLYIIVGALLLLSVLKYSGGLEAIRYHFTLISSDKRVQIVIIGWLFGSFMEGASGFGTPAAVIAPLLVALRFPAMAAVLVGLMVQSTAVTFGAIGTPILIGVNNGLAADSIDAAEKLLFIQEVTAQASIIHGIVGTFIPWFMMVMVILSFGKKSDRKKCITIAPFAIFSGLAFTIPYMLTAIFFGPEFPSLLGAMVGLILVVVAVKYKFLLPKDTWDFPEKDNWPESWSGNIQVDENKSFDTSIGLFKTLLPYLLVSVLLVITRREEWGIGDLLKKFNISWPFIFGTDISANSTPLYLPGTMLILAALFAVFLYKMPNKNFNKAFKEALHTSFKAAFVLMFTIPMVRIYINSGINNSDLMSMPVALAEWTASKATSIWPLVSPFIGALGAFIAGSNTVSNLMFTEFQYNVASKLGYSEVLIVSLQAVGAAAGNMVAIHNIVAVSAVVGLMNKEGMLIRKAIIPTLYYLLFAGILGMILTL